MSDNILAPVATIASDDVGGGVQAQRVKLLDATDGSATETGTNAHPLYTANAENGGTIYYNGVACAVQRQVISDLTSGDATLVNSVANKQIVVISCFVVAAGAVSITFESNDGTSDTQKTGAMPLAANGGFVLPRNVDGWFATAAGSSLKVNLSAAIGVYGGITYILV